MPYTLELPRMLRAIVPLVRGERCAGFGGDVIDELVALPLGEAFGGRGRLARRGPRLVPGSAAVVGALNNLSEPATRLRRVDPIRIGG